MAKEIGRFQKELQNEILKRVDGDREAASRVMLKLSNGKHDFGKITGFTDTVAQYFTVRLKQEWPK